MFGYVKDHLLSIEHGNFATRESVLDQIRKLGLGDYASVLWHMPNNHFPRISALLPAMASEETQSSWTGSSGFRLLGESLNFVRAVAANYADITGSSLAGKRILDFGCGYGRFLRLMSFYSDDIWGVDPWDQSVGECNEAGLTKNVFLSDYLPNELPVPDDFDFVFAFSVFTHLSERATKANLAAIRRHIKPGGVACITIRPVEYWRMVHHDKDNACISEKENAHHTDGFSFWPHNLPPIDGDITYGDTSMTLEWLEDRCSELGWKIVATDRSIDDPVQRYVFLRPV